MTTITASFVDRNAMSGALLALAGDDVGTQRVDVIVAPPEAEKATGVGASVGSALGAAAVGTAGVIAAVASGGALIAVGTALAAVSGAAAGGMAGGVVGAVVGGSEKRGAAADDEDDTTVVLRVDVLSREASHAAQVLTSAGGVILATTPSAAGEPVALEGAK